MKRKKSEKNEKIVAFDVVNIDFTDVFYHVVREGGVVVVLFASNVFKVDNSHQLCPVTEGHYKVRCCLIVVL